MKNAHPHVRRVEIGALFAVAATLFTILLISLSLYTPAVQAHPMPRDRTPSSPARPNLTPTPSPTPPVVEVLPSATYVDVGQMITIEIRIHDRGGCGYALRESTLFQNPQALFDYVEPPTNTLGPGKTHYRLSAHSAGTITFTTKLDGEWYCDGIWTWDYLYGTSEPVVVSDGNLSERFYVPIVEGTQ